MGNSVDTWQPGGQGGYRDRYLNRIIGSSIGSQWSEPGSPSLAQYAWGDQTRMRDIEQAGYHKIVRLRKHNTGIRNLNIGHPMALERAAISSVPLISVKKLVGGSTYVHYDGAFHPSTTYKSLMGNLALNRKLAIPSELGRDQAQLWALGSTAIARSIPDVPDFSLPRFIGELREGLPKVPLRTLSQEKKLRSVGGEYLNIQFGLMPTVSDLQKLFQLLFDPRARQFIKRELDKEFRVRKVIDKSESTVNTDLSASSEKNTLPSFLASDVRLTRTRVQSYRIWSSVSFKYYQVSRLQTLINDLERQLGMGVIPTAIDLWNLIPWSWFVDWFVNLDDVITNLSYLGKSGLYLRYGYIMGHFSDVITDRQTCVINGSRFESIGVTHYERKYRVKASPFGFGLTWKEFDPFQTSILGALGISKLRF